jgi:hypothetical protein
VKNYLDDPEVMTFLLEKAKKENGMNAYATRVLAEAHVQEVVPIILEYLRGKLHPNTGGGGIYLLETATGHMTPEFGYVDTVEKQRAMLDEWEAFWKKHKDEPADVRARAEIEYLITVLRNKDEYMIAHHRLCRLTGHTIEGLPVPLKADDVVSGEESPQDPPMEKVEKAWQDWWKANKDTFKPPAPVP